MQINVPEVVFLVAVIVTAVLEQRYFAAVAELDPAFPTMANLTPELRGHPRAVVRMTARIVAASIPALFSRQESCDVESKRRQALGAIGGLFVAFAWVGSG